jgi:hypothetical protein
MRSPVQERRRPAGIIRGRKWLLVALGVLASVAMWLMGGERQTYAVVSPDETYRLQFYQPARYHHLLNRRMESPGFARLYRNRDPFDLVGESPVVDLNDKGQVFWHQAATGEVAVGMVIVFRNVHPMTPDGEILPLPRRGP